MYVSFVSFRVHPLASQGELGHEQHQYQMYCLESVVERFGIFSMIVIGEGILALLLYPEPSSFTRYICVFFAFGLCFLFAFMYWNSHAEEGCHALHKIAPFGSVMWIALHLPLSASLLCVGVGLKLLVKFADLDRVPPEVSCILLGSVPSSICLFYILRRCHDKFLWSIPSLLRLVPIVICPFGLFISFDSFGVILWCFIVAISSWFFDIILINEYETKPVWLTNQQQHGEFEFHPEEYPAWFLPIDSFLFCKNYDGEHGRTIVVSLAEYMVRAVLCGVLWCGERECHDVW